MENEQLLRDRKVDVVEEHEKRQRADVEPEAVGADRGKAQEDLAEERQHKGEDGEIEEEV